MRKLLIIILVCASFGIPAAMADSSSSVPPMTMTNALQQIENQGYTQLQAIQYRDGKYTAVGLNSQKQPVDIVFNPTSGQIKQTAAHQPKTMSLMEVANKVQQAGYGTIYGIQSIDNGREFEVSALNSNDAIIRLRVNGSNGTVTPWQQQNEPRRFGERGLRRGVNVTL